MRCSRRIDYLLPPFLVFDKNSSFFFHFFLTFVFVLLDVLSLKPLLLESAIAKAPSSATVFVRLSGETFTTLVLQ